MARRINSRAKGAAAEKELAKTLAEMFAIKTRRGLSQAGGASCRPDIDLSQSPLKDIHIECKFVEKLNISEAMSQALRDVHPGAIPCVMHRRSREPWHVTLLLSDLIEFSRTIVNAAKDPETNH